MSHHNKTLPKPIKWVLLAVVMFLGGCAQPNGQPNYAMYNLGQSLMNNHGYIAPPVQQAVIATPVPGITHVSCQDLGYGQAICRSY